jgi:hypothetical protein
LNGNDTTSGLPRHAGYGLAGLIALSCGVFMVGAGGEPQRIWANLLVVGYGLLGLGLGGAVLLALLFVTGARWSKVIRPAAEKLTGLLPIGAVGVAIVLIAYPSLYPWMREVGESGSGFQAFWLSRPFFLLRASIYLALWLGLVYLLVRAARRKDAPADTRIRISAVFLVVFALTCWLASVDWIMSLEPKWSSTIFGVYHFSGVFLGALAAVIVLVVWFDQRGDFGARLTHNHRRDLGTLLFSFSSFWMYLWFCQYLLIWYVNNPEEAEYYVRRQQDAWQPIFLATVIMNWGVPFAVLLFRRAKESPHVLLTVAVIVLLGRWLDVYLMVLPPVVGSASIWDASLLLGTVGLATLILARRSPVESDHLSQICANPRMSRD